MFSFVDTEMLLQPSASPMTAASVEELEQHGWRINANLSKAPWKTLRRGKCLFAKEIEFLWSMYCAKQDYPVQQVTTELLEIADNQREEEEDVPYARGGSITIYYKGDPSNNKETYGECSGEAILEKEPSTRSSICCCHRWHVIRDARMHCLIDSHWTLYEKLKGNGDHRMVEAYLFKADGLYLGWYKYDQENDEYNLRCVEAVL